MSTIERSLQTDDDLYVEVLEFIVDRIVAILKVTVIVTVWVAALALLRFGWTSLFYAGLVGLMACFGTWRCQIQLVTLFVFVAAVAYTVWAR